MIPTFCILLTIYFPELSSCGWNGVPDPLPTSRLLARLEAVNAAAKPLLRCMFPLCFGVILWLLMFVSLRQRLFWDVAFYGSLPQRWLNWSCAAITLCRICFMLRCVSFSAAGLQAGQYWLQFTTRAMLIMTCIYFTTRCRAPSVMIHCVC